MKIDLLLSKCEEAALELKIRLPSGIYLYPKVEPLSNNAVCVKCHGRELIVSELNYQPKETVISYFKDYMEDLLEQYKIDYFRQYKKWLG